MSDQANDTLNLKIKYSKDGTQTLFKIKKSAKIQKLVDRFCTKRNLNPRTLTFIFDGQQIDMTKTAEQLGLVDEDEISANEYSSGA